MLAANHTILGKVGLILVFLVFNQNIVFSVNLELLSPL